MSIGVTLTVVFGDTTSVPSSTDKYLIGYASPTITALTHSSCAQVNGSATTLGECPRTGGGRLVIQGNNLGQSGAVVLLGSGVCSDVEHQQPHPSDTVECTLPPGTGIDEGLIFIQDGGAM